MKLIIDHIETAWRWTITQPMADGEDFRWTGIERDYADAAKIGLEEMADMVSILDGTYLQRDIEHARPRLKVVQLFDGTWYAETTVYPYQVFQIWRDTYAEALELGLEDLEYASKLPAQTTYLPY